MASLPQVYDVIESYDHPRDYVADELLRLDVIIECEIQRMQAVQSEAEQALDSFRGMYMSPAEAVALIEEEPARLRLTADQEAMVRQLDLRIAARLGKTRKLGKTLPALVLQDRFGLSELDLRMLTVALAPHVNRKYLKLYGYLHDDLTRQYVTPELILRLCCATEEERQRALEALLGAEGPLRPFFVSAHNPDPVQEASVLLRPVRLTGRMVHFLLGLAWRHAGPLSSIRRFDGENGAELPGFTIHRELLQQTLRQARRAAESGASVVWMVHGPPGSGKTLLARHTGKELGRPVLEWDVSAAPEDEANFKAAVDHFLLEAKLAGAIPALAGVHLIEPEGGEADRRRDRRREWLVERLETWRDMAFVMGEREFKPARLVSDLIWIPVALPAPDLEESRRLWLALSEGKAPLGEAEAALLAGKFRFTPGQIAAAVETAQRLARWTSLPAESGKSAVLADAGKRVHRAAYQYIDHRLRDKAVKLEAGFGWDDLVLPAETLQLLRQACLRLKHRHTVLKRWGFESKLPYGKGTSMLFTGPPGTGKTMSAIVMANELNAELYRIDLSRVVSKYIGETEKNLSEIFDQARLGGAILFFDEADALFGKRSEVKDAHDKYANMETSYLLQKMEEYDGLTILATNFAQNLDEAFMRRIPFIVKFPFPDAVQREQLWKSSFPPQVPLADIDFPFLAQTFELAGGPIKNIALTAAYLAADEGVPVSMKQIVEGVIQEYKKTGKLFPKDRLGSYASFWKG